MARKKLSRELKPKEIPQDADETMPEAVAMGRRPPSAKPAAGGAEHRAGEERDDDSRYDAALDRAQADPEREQPEAKR